MFEEELPNKKIGYLSPLPVIENGPYEFYQLVPKGILLVMIAVGLQEFTRKDVERVFSGIDHQLELLRERGVDVILQAGVPLPLIAGPDFLARLLSYIENRANVPATSTVLNVVAAIKHLDLKKIAVANKWSNQMNATLEEFFSRDGISVVGVNTRSMNPSEFVKLSSAQSITLGYELGRRALEEFPAADGVYIGGGTWLTLPIITKLESEFHKPVITNQIASVWHVLHLLNCWERIAEQGMLLNSD